MIIYQNTKAGFVHQTFSTDIHEIVHELFMARTGQGVGASEIASWRNSLVSIARVLNTPAIPDDCGLAIEYGIPQTSKRLDVLLTGRDADDRPSVAIVELKQWSEAETTDKDATVRTILGGNLVETTHPSYQVWSYAALLQGFNEAVTTASINLHPCAYLHNYKDPQGALLDSRYDHYLDQAPLFLHGDVERDRLRRFLVERLRVGDGGTTLYDIENGRIRPSKNLAEAVHGMLRGNPEFVLIDDQKIVYETALATALRTPNGDPRRVVLVHGGPGTGKSVVAVNLLAEIVRKRKNACYVSKNAAPRAVYESKLVGHMRKSAISALFSGSGAFTTAPKDAFDALIVDEAHRLNEKSGLYGNLGEHQVKEIIAASRSTIFFLDEDQRVTLKDIGSRDVILKHAQAAGAEVVELELASQFRCNGSDGYVAWLDHVLDLRSTANVAPDADAFDFRVFDSPGAVHDAIRERNRERNRARMVAGYCWEWNSRKDPAAWDIEIPEHDYRAQWNLTKDGSLWMISPDSVGEVGCIHTCQGLEADYIGVIIGDDLVVRDGRVVTQPEARARMDQSLKGWKKMARSDPDGTAVLVDQLIKNTYRTLMTRGMKGCYVWCADDEVAERLRDGWGSAR